MARRKPPAATGRFSVLASGDDVPWRTREEAEAESAPAGGAPGGAPTAEESDEAPEPGDGADATA